MLESLKCKVIIVVVGFESNPSSERLICCLAKCLSLYCEVDIVVALCLASSVEVVLCLREELCTPGYCIAQNPQWRFPVWTS